MPPRGPDPWVSLRGPAELVLHLHGRSRTPLHTVRILQTIIVHWAVLNLDDLGLPMLRRSFRDPSKDSCLCIDRKARVGRAAVPQHEDSYHWSFRLPQLQ